VKFDELLKDIKNDYKINGLKLADLNKCLKHLEPFFKGVSVPKIKTEQIEDYIKNRMALTCQKCDCKVDDEALEQGKCPFCKIGKDFEPGAANGTINRELAALKRILNFGKQKDKVDRAPYIPMLKEDNVRKGFFEHPEFLALRDALSSYLKGFATFGYRTGWRISEISSLTWNKIVRKNGMVRSGVPESVAMKISGHKTRSVFDRYNIVSGADLKEAALKQEKYLNG
jgi:integrase